MKDMNIVDRKMVVNVSIECDEYVPFSITFGVERPDLLCYWRMGDGKRSLVEIGVNCKSGALFSLTLVNFDDNNISFIGESYSIGDLPIIEGLPVFDSREFDDVRDFAHRFVDDFSEQLVINVFRNAVSLMLTGAESVVRYIQNGDVRFGLSEFNRLVSLDVLGTMGLQLIKQQSFCAQGKPA